ncbi:hypothetical protein [Shinella sp. G-2]|uniref:hypothetical protein n=1 Tax=Shinella sp. G-2 TaxID=3133141 RepID=UPI003D002B6F
MTLETTPARSLHPGFLRIGGGYLLAVVTASLVVNALFAGLSTGSDEYLPSFLIIGCVYTFVCALPGFIATVLAARYLGFQNPVFFILAGGLDSILSLALFDGFVASERLLLTDSFAFIAVAGGLAGGFVYWLAAHRLRGTRATPLK